MDLKRIGSVLVFMICVSISFSGSIEFYHQRYLEKQLAPLPKTSISQREFQQLIDHNNPSLGTFSQRYYVDESLGLNDDAPVLFYICGESACKERALNGAIRDYAKKFQAKLVALEHRYYGQSFPHATLSTHDLRDLSTRAALQDLANFQKSLAEQNHWTGKWVAFGGSYPGSLSAYYRLYYPELVVGALASSAPVMAKEDFYEYDLHVAKVAGPQCAAQMRLVVNQIEQALADKNRLSEIKEQFLASDVHNNIDFLYLVADVGAAAVQYGMHDQFCSALSDSNSPLDGYANFAKFLYKKWDISAIDLTAEGAMNEDPSYYDEAIGSRQWYYQSCTEYGYWQVANPDTQNSTRSAFINLEYHRNLCLRLFGLTAPADTSYVNKTFYSPLMDTSVSRIFFTNGALDPWSNLSLSANNGNNTNPNLTYTTIDGAAHCDDLRTPKSTDSSSLKSARQELEDLLTGWLK